MSAKRASAVKEEILTKRVRREPDNEADNEEISEESEGDEDEEDEDEDSAEFESDSDTEETGASSALSGTDLFNKKQEILSEYRQLSMDLKNERPKIAREGGLKRIKALIERMNELKEVAIQHKLSQEISLYDSRNLKEVGDLMDLGMRSIKIGSTEKALRPNEFIRRLKIHLLADSMNSDVRDDDDDRESFLEQSHDFNEFNWFSLGTFLYSRGSKPISTGHLLGPLEIEKKIRQVQSRAKADFSKETVTAQNLTSNEINADSTNHTTNAVLNCYKIFHSKAKGRKMNIFEFFINPNSFSQSIENMFYTSFLVRDGRLVLEEDEEGYPVISELPPLPSDPRARDEEIARRHEKPSNHIIFQLEYDSWQNLVQKFNITKSFIPDRG
jgi:hypothetical protein